MTVEELAQNWTADSQKINNNNKIKNKEIDTKVAPRPNTIDTRNENEKRHFNNQINKK